MITINDIDSLLLEEVPEFSAIYDEHFDDYDEILHHVLFGDLTRFTLKAYIEAKESSQNWDLFFRITNFIEKLHIEGDPEVKNLVGVSFLENLHQAGKYYEEIKALLGEETSKEVKAMDSWNQRFFGKN